ncbi:RNA 2',3'-cyclic phosphodiesterase [Shewanella mesophila]|uniref:RNA 2',3'-cyclic phosphodiesterase n=1 Tax=Shewanella mesophila TaxID=2864208 RepID=UPI001C659082|nr:RNA 2',3'-cyclic phosphodiesterase [Shewanella mesophila]QYJ85633.1 RNA 2',3'-cyclic phosphodiesterase [Shewanella mesophila]
MIKRLFLGISPSSEQANILAHTQSLISTDGRAIPKDNFHVTLYFLGQVDEQQQTQLIKTLNQLNAQNKLKPFSVDLEAIEWWQKPKVICLAGIAKDPALIKLHQTCRQLSHELNLHQSERLFTPHITLFRKAREYSPQQIAPLTITAHELHLYHSVSSESGISYPIIHSWQLTASTHCSKKNAPN